MKKSSSPHSSKILQPIKKQKKKMFSFKEKATIVICAVIIWASFAVILVKAVATWNPPVDISNVVGAPVTILGPTPQSYCCGTAHGKIYSCSDKSFGNDTLCKYPAKLHKFNKKVSFPGSGNTVNWLCECGNQDSSPILMRRSTVASCSATKKEAPKCSSLNNQAQIITKAQYELLHTSIPLYANELQNNLIANQYTDKLCANGGAIKVVGFGNNGYNGTGACMSFIYQCLCNDGKQIGSDCRIRYCYFNSEKPSTSFQFCGDFIVDKNIGEECDRNIRLNYNIMLGHTCADKGLCGQIKCTNACKLDYSDCRPCISDTQTTTIH